VVVIVSSAAAAGAGRLLTLLALGLQAVRQASIEKSWILCIFINHHTILACRSTDLLV
jgi:hypothetical protein